MPKIRIENNSQEFANLVDNDTGRVLFEVPPKRDRTTNLSEDEWSRSYQSLRRLIDHPLINVTIIGLLDGEGPTSLPGDILPGERKLHEELTPDPDGNTKTFYLDNEPIDGTTRIFVNMVEQPPDGNLSSYTQNDDEIVFESAPGSNYYLTAIYRHY